MKTFIETFQDSVNMVDGTTFIDERDYRAIQIDALEHVAKVITEVRDRIGNTAYGPCDYCVRSIQSEIQKLKEGK